MPQMQAPSAIDDMQSRLPSALKWGLMGGGAAAGWYYGRGTAIPLSYVIGGAAAGFCLVACAFASLRLLKAALICGVVLLVVNEAWLVPMGYGDRLPAAIEAIKAVLRQLDPAPLTRRWGKSVETGPVVR